jgi:hypothetical protein
MTNFLSMQGTGYCYRPTEADLPLTQSVEGRFGWLLAFSSLSKFEITGAPSANPPSLTNRRLCST